MQAFKLTFEYDGTLFRGWQSQPGVRTVQDVVEERLSQLFGHPVRIHGAGRTDAGVHALGQVAHVHTTRLITAERIRHSLNGMLPEDVSVTRVDEVALDFHARMSAAGKRYRYEVLNRRSRSARRGRYQWHVPFCLDLDVIDSGLRALEGRHDFAAFCSADATTTTSVRELWQATLNRGDLHDDGRTLVFEFYGSGFLKYQVRSMVGTLIGMGMGKASPSLVEALLESKRREDVGVTAPAQGLTLVEVIY